MAVAVVAEVGSGGGRGKCQDMREGVGKGYDWKEERGEKEEQTHPLPASALLPSSRLFPSCSTALPGIRGLKLSVITRGGRKEGERKSGVMACFCFYRGVYTTALVGGEAGEGRSRLVFGGNCGKRESVGERGIVRTVVVEIWVGGAATHNNPSGRERAENNQIKEKNGGGDSTGDGGLFCGREGGGGGRPIFERDIFSNAPTFAAVRIPSPLVFLFFAFSAQHVGLPVYLHLATLPRGIAYQGHGKNMRERKRKINHLKQGEKFPAT